MKQTHNLHVLATAPLLPPRALKEAFPISERSLETVVTSREEVKAILAGRDRRLLIIAGPCSIHDPQGALEYATRLSRLRQELSSRLCLIMRVYFEKPRTTVGWKGLINDPHLDGTYDIEAGLKSARLLLLEVTGLGLPAATEFLDPIVPQYIAELISWAAIGARTTESQTHREMASGLSMPVGYKNSTDGSLQIAIDAMTAARQPHSFLGIDLDGVTSIIRTTGNLDGHVVLRGGRVRPNYDAQSITEAVAALGKAGLPSRLMVDCSHANSLKQHARQEEVWRSVVEQRVGGSQAITGMMVESNLHEGSQPLSDPRHLAYGVSITDACINWETTERMLRHAYEQLKI